jgi:uncharacterized protein
VDGRQEAGGVARQGDGHDDGYVAGRTPVPPTAQLPVWAAETARILVYLGLFVALSFMLGGAWYALPIPDTGAWVFSGTLVTAAAAVLAGVAVLRLADGRPAAALGIGVSGVAVRQSVLGFGIGAAALLATALGMLVTGSLGYAPAEGTAVTWAAALALHGAIFAVAAFAEEALFRGYAFQVLARWGGPAVATVLTAALFALAHGSNPEVGWVGLVNIFLAGLLLGIAYLRTLSLWFVTALHMAWNWTMASLLDMPVSGWAVFDTPLYDATLGGPGWWSGAGFGPEGGLVGTLGFSVALLLVLRLRGVTRDEHIAAARPLVLDRVAGGINGEGEGQ